MKNHPIRQAVQAGIREGLRDFFAPSLAVLLWLPRLVWHLLRKR
ncbi:hypothetical protein Psesu_2091 [Pseudoxanthomonas suwonensis 11-1]|uniref:Uncharacterized protein n=1 Tax=Pseudoxanthomonas suwonensis (strain 11-1) TaxID=743721 RepID=E6WUE3_PSEUU|nr:hypothetical protein [Pseudoxanthomonas suwonensis]ADV27927.1 hypothetical protein Psesu_2091 [Pseudoxanthomonas suwonensis 11-1]